MAAANLLALIDDIATVLDDVAVLTKLAARKTAGVLGDDLALNAQQVAGVKADREIPVVWAVAKGSFINKAILVPGALAISAIAPWAVIALLMVGGAYLCFEGFEKLVHLWQHRREDKEARRAARLKPLVEQSVDLVTLEKAKIKGAIRTDFILSAEIVIITLGTVAAAPFPSQVFVLIGIAIVMTVGVYGLVAGIVKLDDAGLYLSRREGEGAVVQLQRAFGNAILAAAPWLMRLLSIVGTAAMFLVGGGIIVHGVPALHQWAEGVAHGAESLPKLGGVLGSLTTLALNSTAGIVAGAFVLLAMNIFSRLRRSKPAAK